MSFLFAPSPETTGLQPVTAFLSNTHLVATCPTCEGPTTSNLTECPACQQRRVVRSNGEPR